MAAVNITKREVVEIEDSKGIPIIKGDPIELRIKGEDIVCRFVGIDSGYFTTVTLDGQHENKYRFGSIENCIRIDGIMPYSAAIQPMPVAENL